MEPSQATELVAYLAAVYRPRDFGDASAIAYARSIEQYDYDEARRAVEWIAEHSRFMPSLAELRAEIADDYFAPPIDALDRTALPGHAAVNAVRLALPGPEPEPVVRAEDSPLIDGTLADAIRYAATHPEPDMHIDYDPEQVRRRKAEAREAAEKVKAAGAAEGGQA